MNPPCTPSSPLPHTKPEEPSTNNPVTFEQLALSCVPGHLATLDEDVFRPGRQLEGIAAPHDDVRVLADLQRPVACGDPPYFGGRERHCAERRVAIHPVRDRVSGF